MALLARAKTFSYALCHKEPYALHCVFQGQDGHPSMREASLVFLLSQGNMHPALWFPQPGKAILARAKPFSYALCRKETYTLHCVFPQPIWES